MLRLVRIEAPPPGVTWSIDSPTTGVVILDAGVTGAGVEVPLHWRAGTWTKPPLDVMVDYRGRLAGFQFVLQDELVEDGVAPGLSDAEDGRPVFDVGNWPADRYLDEKMPVEAMRLAGGELLLQIGAPEEPERACRVDTTLKMGFSSQGHLCEIRIGPLSAEDWEALNAFPGSPK